MGIHVLYIIQLSSYSKQIILKSRYWTCQIQSRTHNTKQRCNLVLRSRQTVWRFYQVLMYMYVWRCNRLQAMIIYTVWLYYGILFTTRSVASSVGDATIRRDGTTSCHLAVTSLPRKEGSLPLFLYIGDASRRASRRAVACRVLSSPFHTFFPLKVALSVAHRVATSHRISYRASRREIRRIRHDTMRDATHDATRRVSCDLCPTQCLYGAPVYSYKL